MNIGFELKTVLVTGAGLGKWFNVVVKFILHSNIMCAIFFTNADFFAGIGYQVAVAFAKSGAEKVNALSRSQSE